MRDKALKNAQESQNLTQVLVVSDSSLAQSDALAKLLSEKGRID